MITVRSIEPREWQRYREVRLQALRDSPDAFGSTHKAEAAQPDGFWSARIAAATTSGKDRALFALNHEAVCGLVWCKLSATEADRADLFQMWIDPASRGLGAGRALLDEAIAWAKGLGAQRMCLSVTEGDTPALRLYQARGFRPVGPMDMLREGSGLKAQPMELECGSRRGS